MLRKRNKLAVSLLIGFLLVLVSVVLWELQFELRAQVPARVAVRIAGNSKKVRQYLGSPIRSSHFIKGRMVSDSGSGNADLTFRVRGPLGRGVLSEWAQEQSGKWQICSLTFHSNDGAADIAIVDDFFTHCERE